MRPVRLRDVARAVEADGWPQAPDGPVEAVCTDTRALAPGSVFVALAGERFDGHRFVAQAFLGGAVAAIVHRSQVETVRAEMARAGAAGVLLPVTDTLTALGDLARWYRSQFPVAVVGVTGSVGKTSTKEMIAAILGERGPVVCTEANYNNEIGVPLTLFRLDDGHTAAVVELAMRGAGQIAYLAAIARPGVGVITNIGTSHLELLGSQEAIARAKGELLAALPPDGAAILPAGDPFLPLLREMTAAPVTTFGMAGAGDPDVAVEDLEAAPEESRFALRMAGRRVMVRLPVPGRHHALNAAAAAAAAMRAGASVDDVAAGLARARLPGKRMEVVRTPAGVLVLNDAYNASPASMAAALEHLRQIPGGRHVAVLGDMLELGSASDEAHREAGRQAAWVDLLVAVGERSRQLAAAAMEAGLAPGQAVAVDDAEAALQAVRQHVRPGDVVLVKASRALRLETVVEGLQHG